MPRLGVEWIRDKPRRMNQHGGIVGRERTKLLADEAISVRVITISVCFTTVADALKAKPRLLRHRNAAQCAIADMFCERRKRGLGARHCL